MAISIWDHSVIDQTVVDHAVGALRQSKKVAFRGTVSPTDTRAWMELVRDVVAMANSGGGSIVLDSGADLLPQLLESVAQYTGDDFEGVDQFPATRDAKTLLVLVIEARTGSPLVFERPATVEDGDTTAVFAQGSMYFRHGARSEPATARDVERFFDHELGRIRKGWLRNVRKISSAPVDAEVIVSVPNGGPSARIERFRVVHDPNAPAVALTDFDVTHPYRQKDVISALNEHFGEVRVSSFDLLSIRRVYGIDESKEEFFHHPKFGSPQYSEDFVNWMLDEYGSDPTFFEKAKDRYKEMREKEMRASALRNN